MGWLKKVLGKEQSHDDWLAAHPGKGSMAAPPAGVSPDEQAAMRGRMEKELRDQGEKMRKG